MSEIVKQGWSPETTRGLTTTAEHSNQSGDHGKINRLGRIWHDSETKPRQDQSLGTAFIDLPGLSRLERVTGIEPALSAWELQGSWLVDALTWS
ncbi:hypothetical protein E1267_34180 [Nonomuraea longispora]|uniref:Uncharacterized protein n=1 Tax=Nonomuraea longispora TaxID=1848320 RepID=A0A4R4MWN2_9ACTN|nr:hypothetical protein [Nonomuraea longispora]TDC00595.1 hypothetical protein E1267_34180 [Nonomuraea longispora]